MDARDEELVRTLAPGNAGLRRSYEKHARLKAEVDELSSKPRLTSQEELHRRALQKQKLAEKDRIIRMLDEHRRERGEATSGN
jgi:uncharacterized protein YdcH (DUF465 family)